ncbi:ribonuclease H-like domain-containing protein [Tanacetum coccineum]
MKIHNIRKGDMNIWRHKNAHIYLSHRAYPMWSVIVNILLLAIPDEYLLKFHNVADAKSLWEAIKSRFGVVLFLCTTNTILQLENEEFSAYDEDDLKNWILDGRWAKFTVRVKKFIQKTGRNLDFKEKRHVSLDKSKIKCYNCHRKGHFARDCRSRRNQGRRSYGDNGRSNAPTNESSSQALVAQDGLGGYDWSNDFKIEPEESSKNLDELLNSQMSARDKTGLGYGTQLNEMSNNSETNSEISLSVFDVRSSDEESTLANDRSSKKDGYRVVPPLITGNLLTPRADISFVGLDEYAIKKKIIELKTN